MTTRPGFQAPRSASGVRGESFRGATPPPPPTPLQPGIAPEPWRNWNRPAPPRRSPNWGGWIVVAVVAVILIGVIGSATTNSGGTSSGDANAYPTYDYATAKTDTTQFQPDIFPPNGPFFAVGSLHQDRAGHTATLLEDGRVLIAGGYMASNQLSPTAINSVEIYDPATGLFKESGSLLTPRSNAAAARLDDGTVLIAGGKRIDGSILQTAEVYDPKTGVSVETGSMSVARSSTVAIALDGGRVLIVGGDSPDGWISGADIYDPAERTFSKLDADFDGPVAATKLLDGRVLVAGGMASYGPSVAAWIYAPDTGLFTQVGNLSVGRDGPTSCLLPDGKVMVVGGLGAEKSVNYTADVFDPNLEAFSSSVTLADYRYRGTTTALPDGSAVLMGGVDDAGTPIGSVESVSPDSGPIPVGTMTAGRADQTATTLNDGTVLIVGGLSDPSVTTGTASLYAPNGLPKLAPSGSAGSSGSLKPSQSASASN